MGQAEAEEREEDVGHLLTPKELIMCCRDCKRYGECDHRNGCCPGCDYYEDGNCTYALDSDKE